MTSPHIIHGANLIVPEYGDDNILTLHPGALRDGGHLSAGEKRGFPEWIETLLIVLLPLAMCFCAVVGITVIGWAR